MRFGRVPQALVVTVAAVVYAALAIVSTAAPAAAGGSWFDPVKDRYEPGEEATLVGYTGGGAFGWIEDGPFFGYLLDSNDNGEMVVDGPRRPLGEIELEDTGRSGYLQLRASITFTVPAELEPGVYGFDYCNADCSQRLGDLIGGLVYVGVDPAHPISREWPVDDPQVANLDDDARIAGPGFDVSAGDVRDGEAIRPAAGGSEPRPETSGSVTSTTTTGTTTSATTTAVDEATTAPTADELDLAAGTDSVAADESGDTIPWGYGGLAVAIAVGFGVAAGRKSRSKEPQTS